MVAESMRAGQLKDTREFCIDLQGDGMRLGACGGYMADWQESQKQTLD